MGGGKTNTTTQQTTVPQDVLDRYNQVNQTAQQTASQPFQQYSTDPNAFVAPLNSTQQAGIAGTNSYANSAQPYYGAATGELLGAQNQAGSYYQNAGQQLNNAGQTIGGLQGALNNANPYNTAATGLTAQSAQAVNADPLTGQDINQYMSPYLNDVLGSTSALINQNNQQQMAGQLGNIIGSGAFGGDRGGIAAANLAQQQQLANASTYSGIANTAYNNALGVAQQQQGVNLGAAQANRAALGAAGQQLAGIGNQVYNQGTNTEQQQYGQQTGLATAQQGLGQSVYNTGANTSSALAALGTGAQSAGLAGAQAQLAAGQQQQQTQQAGDTALYNQFLQQQSYPFQVAQFLANIAEGTGSLSGQTTSTTQPGSLLSDERTKKDKEVIGKTFDGQPIYKFKYKGDSTTHMGLMAQEVEKRHPEAVSESGGLKAVNYDVATQKAAERGHFEKGGLVPYKGYAMGGSPSGGFDPQLMQQILSNSQGMYGPYMAAVGGGEASSGSGPYGGSGRVPTANVPVGKLNIPNMQIAKPNSGLHEASQAAGDVSSLYNNVQKGVDFAKGLMPKGSASKTDELADDTSLAANDSGNFSDLSTDIPDFGYRKGGLVKRYATGGMPYSDPNQSLDIPNEQNSFKLPDPPKSSNQDQNNPLSDITNLAKTGVKLASTLGPLMAMMNRGGLASSRKGYDSGGSPNFDESGVATYGGPDVPGDPNFDETGATFDKNFGGLHPQVEDMKRFLAGNSDTNQEPISNEKPKGVSPVTAGDMWEFAHPQSDTSKTKKSSSSKSSGLSSNSSDEWSAGPPTDYRPTATPAGGLAPSNPDIAAPAPAQLNLNTQTPEPGKINPNQSQDQPGNGGGLGALANIAKTVSGKVAPEGGYLDKLAHGDQKAVVSLLAGLGAMTAAPTRNFGTALAQGLAQGAKAYQGTQDLQANLALKGAQTEQTRAQVGQTQATTAKIQTDAYHTMQAKAPTGYQAVQGIGPKGEQYLGPDGKPWHYVLQTALTDYGQGAAQNAVAGAAQAPKSGISPDQQTDQFMAQNYNIDPSLPGVANHTRMLAMNPALATQEESAAKSAQNRIGNLQEADTTHRQLLQSADSLSQLSQGSLTGQGYNSAYRAQLANIYSTMSGMLGIPVDPSITKDLTAHQVTEKIRQLSGAQQAHQYGERAASIAHSISNVMPSGDLTPQAASDILSNMLIQNQQQKDFSQYYNGFVNKYGTSVNVEPMFQKQFGNNYDTDQRNLKDVLGTPKFGIMTKYLSDPDPKTRAAAIQKVDAKYGDGFHRYLTGGQ